MQAYILINALTRTRLKWLRCHSREIKTGQNGPNLCLLELNVPPFMRLGLPCFKILISDDFLNFLIHVYKY